MDVTYEIIPYLNISTNKIKSRFNYSKDILCYSEIARIKTLTQEKNKNKKQVVPLWEKLTLTIEEAAEYSGIGIHKIRQLTDKNGCDFVLWNGNRRLIKRKKFDDYIDKSYSI